MKKQYIKMNNNDSYLSLGNLFRLIKELSVNKSNCFQTIVFETIFEIEQINLTTVNNYLVGIRSIGSDYKQIYLNKKNRYEKNKEEFTSILINLCSIIDGVNYQNIKNPIEFINSNQNMKTLANKLYNIAKNDSNVKEEQTNEIKDMLNDGKIYESLVSLLLYIVLEHKQPLYEEEQKILVMENLLSDTSISAKDLEEYLNIKLREGINYFNSLKLIAKNGNAYANYELGCNEYYGYTKGYKRYDKALEYLKVAADKNHAPSCYMIGNMYLKGLIGSRSDLETQIAYEYLIRAKTLGNIASINTLGNMYQEGIYPLEKDINKSIELYEEAAKYNYSYALNNLGLIKEKDNNLDDAYNYYLKSANLGESWANNKVGNYLRENNKLDEALPYYKQAIEGNYQNICYYAYHNLAKYYYSRGFSNLIYKDLDKAKKYYQIASDNGIIESMIELFLMTYQKYLNTKDEIIYQELITYKKKIETHEKYNDELRKLIEDKLFSIPESIDLGGIYA